MPYARPMHVSELHLYAIGAPHLTAQKIASIETKIAKGAKLTMECSSASDPGGDYTRVLLDGVEIARMEGY